MMLPETLLDRTLNRFPRFSEGSMRIEPLEKGGSDRKYYRVAVSGDFSIILVKYGDQREENRHYVEIAQFLHAAGINAPEIYFHDPDEGLIWMQDLGSEDLWSFREEAWPDLREKYFAALDQLAHLHSRAHLHPGLEMVRLQPGFTEELYRWEQNYFFENCLGRHFQCDVSSERWSALADIARKLAALPQVLVHRDFQSQNIMMVAPSRGSASDWLSQRRPSGGRDREAYFIDFQGLRHGLGQYDLASLIYDPYTELSLDQRHELTGYYLEKLRSADIEIADDFAEILDLCAMQRLMQALGAYGFLGHVKERLHFLEHIPAAMDSLCEVVSRLDGFSELAEILVTHR